MDGCSLFQKCTFIYMYLVITVLPINPKSGMGWKSGDDRACMEYRGTEFIDCIEKNAFSSKEVFLNTTRSWPVTSKHFYTNNISAVLHYVEDGGITQKVTDTLILALNSSLQYYIHFTDPKLQVTSDNPNIVPRILLTLKEHGDGFIVYLKVYYIYTGAKSSFILSLSGHKT